MDDRRRTNENTAKPDPNRTDESQKRGGYLAPAIPFELPKAPPGPGQGGAPTTDKGGQTDK
ncbi:hypothetical protein [Actinosynnema mirum]|uniref:Uncharacterized protein n=1 Tax=Actinosynnema mirum (strain ATCC 29888 / DSM 43827 / JCM 3225 / NBRC 14064 / NCIMB 13271 / NRRL B-12336 / IMRU 3971 / 101) TaxID=446462 RepID=C6WF25_ACTMD|nr:hypothetical protein [Actinosynnema mirum]ACU34157.1 hypothetical protein Amir_0186 [Actinosynnema mirum DSM 43827]